MGNVDLAGIQACSIYIDEHIGVGRPYGLPTLRLFIGFYSDPTTGGKIDSE
jgi:hypothetical protein